MIERTFGATLAELTSLEQLFCLMHAEGLVERAVVDKLWEVYASTRPISRAQRRGSIMVLSMLAKAERDLALTLDAFNTAVSDAYDKRMPHLIAEHAYRLAQSFSKFYAACPVLIAPDEATKRSRLALSAAALRQLEIALNLLGIDTPERM